MNSAQDIAANNISTASYYYNFSFYTTLNPKLTVRHFYNSTPFKSNRISNIHQKLKKKKRRSQHSCQMASKKP